MGHGSDVIWSSVITALNEVRRGSILDFVLTVS